MIDSMVNGYDKMRQADHDLLIRLETIVNKIAEDVKELKDGTNTKLENHGARLALVEKFVDEHNSARVLQKVEEHHLWIRDFQTRWATVLVITSAVTGIVVFVLDKILKFFKII